MFTLIGQPQTVKITKALAAEFAAYPSIPGDRPLSENREAALLSEFERGEVITFNWTLGKLNGVWYRINGKHSSTVLAQMSGNLPAAWACISRYNCPTAEDAALLYGKQDSKISTRTCTDLYNAMAASCPALEGLHGQLLSFAARGIAMHMAEGTSSSTRTPVQERALWLTEHSGFVLCVHALATEGSSKQAKHLVLRGPLIGSMFASWLKNREKTREFWAMVRDGTAEPNTHPSRKLRDWLLTTRLASSGGTKRETDPREMYVKGIHAWNAWREERTTDLRYYKNLAVPKAK